MNDEEVRNIIREEFSGSHIKQIGRRTTREKALEWEGKGGKR